MPKKISTTMIDPQLPATGFVRIRQVLVHIPISRTAWFNGVREGRYPRPVKLGARSVGWKVEDVRQLIQSLGADKPLAA